MIRIKTGLAIAGTLTALVALPAGAASAKNTGELPKGPPCTSGFGSDKAKTVVHGECQQQA